MKVCPNCGYSDLPQWIGSRFDYNADYMRFDEATQIDSLKPICQMLKDKRNFWPLHLGKTTYYRRGKGGFYLYRVPTIDFRVSRERKRHDNDPNQTQLQVVKLEP